MAKLTKAETRKHNAALDVLKKDILTTEDKEFVFMNYHPGANNMNGDAGAFFTPLGMAFEAAFEAPGGADTEYTYIDLCAGIGVLAYALAHRYPQSARIVCVEINPEYVAVGKKLVPEAEWHCMDVMDIEGIKALGHFDVAVSNPPFGRVRTFRGDSSPRYTGGEAEYKVIDVAGLVADQGLFIVPQQSSGFRYSGAQFYERVSTPKYKKFVESFGLELEIGMGMDTTSNGMFCWQKDSGEIVDCNWLGVKPCVEFVTCDYTELEAEPAPVVSDTSQLELFAA